MADPEDDSRERSAATGAGPRAAGDDGLAADWAPTADGARLLSQEEIDSLLGAVEPESAAKRITGLDTLINTTTVSYERLPMLEVVFDRFVRILTTSLRNFTSENVEVHLENIASQRFGEYLNTVPLPAMIAVFRAIEWDNYGLVIVDSPLTYSIVDVLLGGHRAAVAPRVQGRPYTTIERTLVERLVHLLLADLGAAFEPLSRVEFRFERLETNPRFAAITRAGNAVVMFKLRIEMDDRGGNADILVPYATLEPVRDLLLQMFMGEKFGRDSIWESHLAREMWVTHLGLEAVLDEQTLPLGQVMGLTVGSTLMLNASPDAPVHLRCGGVPLLVGRVGRVGDTLAVRVEGKAPPQGAELP